jgi:hypothetical protein
MLRLLATTQYSCVVLAYMTGFYSKVETGEQDASLGAVMDMQSKVVQYILALVACKT